MEDSDKLMNLIQKMSKAQLRQLTRFAEFMLLEDEPDDLNDRGDMRTRYTSFKDALRVDPAAIEAWAKSSNPK
jgi:hypothetical protein